MRIVTLLTLVVFSLSGSIALGQKQEQLDKKAGVKSGTSSQRGGMTSPDPVTAIHMANDYFNASQFLNADFVQIGSDGRRSEGKLYVSKPGRLRFEYAQPSTMEIIADGLSLAVRDRKLKTQEIYFIAQTPLKFLLKTDVDLRNDVRIIDVTSDSKIVAILFEDKATFGGASKIKLFFDTKNFNLRQWEVIDPQGYQTLVTLHNIDTKSRPDANLFRIPQNNDNLFKTD